MEPVSESVNTSPVVEMPPPATSTSIAQPDGVYAVTATDFAVVEEARRRVEEATVRYNTSKAETKERKSELEAAQGAFTREFDRLTKKIHGEVDDLPLFNQTDANEAAMKRAHVQDICGRAKELAHMQLDPLVVAGYSEDQIADLRTWLDDVEKTPTDQPVPDPPTFLFLGHDIADPGAPDAEPMDDDQEMSATIDLETARKINEFVEEQQPKKRGRKKANGAE